MTVTKSFWGCLAAALGLWVMSTAKAEPTPSTRQGDVVSFCRAHGTVDFPGPLFFGPRYTPGAIPDQLSKVDGLSKWRCIQGQVWACSDSADGDWCSKKDASRLPSASLRQACREDTKPVSLSFADEHYSEFDWRCSGDTPVIIKSYPLDQRSFFKSSWVRLVVRGGIVIGPEKFPDGLR